MLITDFASLKFQVLNTLERVNDLYAQEHVDSWIQAAETEFFATLRAQWLIRAATFTWENSDPSGFEYLPPTFNGIVGVADLENGIDLVPKPLSEIGRWSKEVGLAKYYIISGYLINLLPRPDQGKQFLLTYYSKQEPLSATVPTNDILAFTPTLYLYMTLKYACLFFGEDANAAKYGQIANGIVQAANTVEPEWFRGSGATVTLG